MLVEAPAGETPFALTDKDRENLARTDEEYQPHTWENLKKIIASNNLESLRRYPSDLRRYLAWTAETKAAYGTITNFICQERLHWRPLPTGNPTDQGPIFHIQNTTPFADSRDYKILINDWPYGLEKGIVHVVVWLKNRLAVDTTNDKGDLERHSRRLVECFVEKTFVEKLGEGAEDKGSRKRDSGRADQGKGTYVTLKRFNVETDKNTSDQIRVRDLPRP
ncbi:MAG: hypothetical protein Q9183_002088 [Haloplaca sp. 2 TL-2023]